MGFGTELKGKQKYVLKNRVLKHKQVKNSAVKILNNSMFRRKRAQVLVGFVTELKGQTKVCLPFNLVPKPTSTCTRLRLNIKLLSVLAAEFLTCLRLRTRLLSAFV